MRLIDLLHEFWPGQDDEKHLKAIGTDTQDPLVLCVGPRRYVIRPLYSQHIRGGGKGVNNVHKSEKFLRPGAATVATTFGPVCFGKTACASIGLSPAGRERLPLGR